MNHGELVRDFLSRIDALCAEKLSKYEKEIPKEDISALVISRLPQELSDRILKVEEMIEKGWQEAKKTIVREAERKRKTDNHHKNHYREYRRPEKNNTETQSGNLLCMQGAGSLQKKLSGTERSTTSERYFG